MDARRAEALPVRYAGLDDIVNRIPVSVVWEITLACDLACSHCGSRAGRRRRDELNTAEALDLVDQIAELGARDVGLIGGEAYLRKDWIEIVAAIRAAGMRCDLQSGVLDPEIYFHGCNAGDTVMGIEADGTIKSYPGLGSAYAGGNVRETRLREIWEKSEVMAFNRRRTVDDLWGFCRTCYYAETCMAGCTWTSHALMGRAGNNPMCHHRALEMDRQGLRERLVKVKDAPGRSFDHGEFEIVVEPVPERVPDRIVVNG